MPKQLTHTDANNKSIKILIVLLMLSSLLWTITMMRKSTIPTKMQAGKLSRYCVSKLKLRERQKEAPPHTGMQTKKLQ